MDQDIFIGQAIIDLVDEGKGLVLDIKESWANTIVIIWWSLKGKTGCPLNSLKGAIRDKEIFVFPKINIDFLR